jgi:hypothetical protein
MTWCKPSPRAVHQTEGSEAPSLNGIKDRVTDEGIAYACCACFLPRLVGNGSMNVRAITGHAPHDATMNSALANASLPESSSVFVWVERVDDA